MSLNFAAFFSQALFIEGIAVDDMGAQCPCGPLAKTRALLGFYPVTDGDDDVEVVVSGIVDFTVARSYPEIPDNCNIFKFTFLEDVLDVFVDGSDVFLE